MTAAGVAWWVGFFFWPAAAAFIADRWVAPRMRDQEDKP